MVRFKTRLMATVFLAVDIFATNLAWIAAYLLRFHSTAVTGVMPVTKGVPTLSQYLVLLPLLSILWPVFLYFHGLYKMTRGRSRIDEFFLILFAVLTGTAMTLGLTLYVRVYYPEVVWDWEYSRAVFAIFVGLDILALNAGRWALRAYLQRMWKAGHNVERILVAGAGDLGESVAATIAEHKELGYRVVGFVDDIRKKPVADLAVLGTLDDVVKVIEEHRVDQVYIALPIEEHAKLLKLIKCVSNECIDIKVVPDVIQYATSKAALEDLDGIPIVSLNEVPLSGWNSMLKRVMDMAVAAALLLVFSPLLVAIAALIKWRGGQGPIFYRQERMSLDGRRFQMYKFRSMTAEAEKDTGPVWAKEHDPRRTEIGVWLRRRNLDELPQLINVMLGDMSLVGPRPERPPFVQQFKERIPQYMLRHRVRSGITGWAQVNGWRGNTSIEKRLECDLYYIENWSLLLDVKILILTLFRGFGQPHAY
jgi:Undecaprenyl-phosphate glucose phosphotransferase